MVWGKNPLTPTLSRKGRGGRVALTFPSPLAGEGGARRRREGEGAAAPTRAEEQ